MDADIVEAKRSSLGHSGRKPQKKEHGGPNSWEVDEKQQKDGSECDTWDISEQHPVLT